MAWTYDPALTALKDQVRFAIGDTNAGDPLIEEDSEITFCLSQTANNVLKAAAYACRRAAAKIIREVAAKGDVFEQAKAKEQFDAFMRLAEDLDKESSVLNPPGVYAGGISISDKDARVQDTDRVKPAFTADLHNNRRG